MTRGGYPAGDKDLSETAIPARAGVQGQGTDAWTLEEKYATAHSKLREIWVMAERSDAHPDCQFAAMARECLDRLDRRGTAVPLEPTDAGAHLTHGYGSGDGSAENIGGPTLPEVVVSPSSEPPASRILGLDNYTLAALRKASQEREDAIRYKLIELGWTPPASGPDRLEADGDFRSRSIERYGPCTCPLYNGHDRGVDMACVHHGVVYKNMAERIKDLQEAAASGPTTADLELYWLRAREGLRKVIAVEHHDDEPDLSHHWQEGMTSEHCPGCIAEEALRLSAPGPDAGTDA